ncbi:hypothetical protein ABZ855_43530, partial [Streptomyces sp. NPDC047042]
PVAVRLCGHHPDAGTNPRIRSNPYTTPLDATCAALLPRLEAIAGQWQDEAGDSLLRRHLDDARQLTVVLRLCVEKDVELLSL